VVQVFVHGEGPPGVDPASFAANVIDAAGAWDLECGEYCHVERCPVTEARSGASTRPVPVPANATVDKEE